MPTDRGKSRPMRRKRTAITLWFAKRVLISTEISGGAAAGATPQPSSGSSSSHHLCAEPQGRRRRLLRQLILLSGVRLVALAVSGAISIWSGPAFAQMQPIDPSVAEEASPRPSRELIYTSSLNRAFPIYVFEADRGQETGPGPALVMFHGGSWRTGEPRQFFRQAAVWNRLGVTVILPVYALERAHGATPRQSVEDAFRAWQAVHQNAAALGIDPAAIAAGGGSAGGHLAAALATLTPPAAVTGHSPPTALVLFNPVIDNSPEGYGADRIGPEWRSYSPLHNIGPGHPPTLIMLGDRDVLVPEETAERYCGAVRASARCELIIYPEATHGWFNDDGFLETLRDSTQFIAELFALDPVTFVDVADADASLLLDDDLAGQEGATSNPGSQTHALPEPVPADE
jgi:acetyl esterase